MHGDAHAVGKFLYFDWEDPYTICPAIELTNPYETLPLALQFEESSPLSLLSVHSSLFFQRPSLKQATQLPLSRYFPVLRVRVYPLLCKPSGNVWTTDCLGQKGIFFPLPRRCRSKSTAGKYFYQYLLPLLLLGNTLLCARPLYTRSPQIFKGFLSHLGSFFPAHSASPQLTLSWYVAQTVNAYANTPYITKKMPFSHYHV